jgi:choline dehydrogenase
LRSTTTTIFETTDLDGASFDYIIVGAGSAGCVLAARLTEDPDIRVAVVEAGGRDNHVWLNMPAGILNLRSSPAFDWGYYSQPIAGCANRTIQWRRGKVLGGSSSVNGMMYVRGHKLDYDRWASLGLQGWSFAECLPYFKKAEANESKLNDPYHSQSGPLGVCDARGGTPIYGSFINAAKQAGYAETADFNGEQQDGFGYFQFNIHAGRRCSTARAYMHPSTSRANLTVLIHSHTTRVLFENKRAVGVEYSQFGVRKRINAHKEVIVCAGTVNSPQLLKLSGVGPADELTRHEIDVVSDSPGVGENLQDHFDYLLEHECLTTDTFDVYHNSRIRKAWAGLQFLLSRSGPGISVPLDVGGFLKTDEALAAPDVQLQMLGALLSEDRQTPGFKIHITILRPESRGRIELGSNDPFDAPKIFPNFLACQSDRDTIRAGVRLTRKILSQPAMDAYRGRELRPGDGVVTDDDLDRNIAAHGEMDQHCVGTCAMGTQHPAVVDRHCRVFGVEGLRVVDASVMPTIIGGNTNAPTIMIAEKIADAIRGAPTASSA